MTAPTPRRTGRRALVVLALVAAAVAAVLAGAPPASSPAAAPALGLTADTSTFQAGNIISDDLFFDGSAMSAADVQAFLAAKGSACTAGSDGSPCLKDYRQDTPNRAADALCGAYAGAPGETAAWIITKVGQACGISQRVLLVILQKEEGLVRTTNPTAGRYRTAMGFGCPDTAACDTQYYGFFNQVYSAGHQYRRYAANPTSYNYRAGVTRAVLYNPNTACGSSQVFIANQATAGLYNYTPYQPNAAALAAGYGTGDSCSAYGNRNFWEYFTDWFGSTQSPGGNAVVARATAPGAAALLGSPTSSVVCGLPTGGGCFEHFQQGSVYWSPATGAQIVRGGIREHWAATGWEAGPLGYPTGEEVCGLRDGGCFETFQKGVMYWTATLSAHYLTGAIQTAWAGQKWETGPLGYPSADPLCGLRDGGCLQVFQGGSEYWSPASGAHTVSGAVLTAWGARSWERGVLGYPTAEAVCPSAGTCSQTFQGGTLVVDPVAGAHVLSGAVLAKWTATGAATGPLGQPTGDTTCGLVAGGCFAAFSNGAVYTSTASGTHVVSGAVQQAWAGLAWERGPLGYPLSDTSCTLVDGGCFAAFQGGSVYWTQNTGAVTVRGVVRDRWQSLGWENGVLGYPVREQVCGLVNSGCFQDFQHGSVYTSPATGTWYVSAPILAAWGATGWEHGPMGYPVGNTVCGLVDGGCFSAFQTGAVYWTPGGGAHVVTGAIQAAWGAQGWERGPLGYPTADQVCGRPGGGCVQTFAGGTIAWTQATGAQVVSGTVLAEWTAQGGEGGALGYPSRGLVCGLVRGGCFQDFTGGAVYSSPTGTWTVRGAIQAAWGAQGWERGSLGYPTGDAVTASGTVTQPFEGGTLVQDVATGRVTRR